MRCPALSELPPPPPGKLGWPWTEESPRLPDMMENGSSWPLISIVTPSYNQGRFIEGTIRSVLLQGYPNLEYVIIDGSSTDNSVEIIRKYEKWLAHWVSEPDKGQAHAINKGFREVTGEVLAWLNSDDEYCPKAFCFVARHFQGKPNMALLYGDCEMVDDNESIIGRIKGQHGDLTDLLIRDFIPQPSAFFHRQAWEAVGGGLDVSLHFALDYELWIRMMLKGTKLQYVPMSLSRFRWHNASKSRRDLARFGFDQLAILERLYQKQEDERLRKVKPHAYHECFKVIETGYLQGIEEGKDQEDEIVQMLMLWARHLEKHQEDYIQDARLWAESLYRIGHHYCFYGHMEQGRRFFSMALQVNKTAYKALLGWGISCMGVKLYRLYSKMRRTLFRFLLRLNCRFLPSYYNRHTGGILLSKLSKP